MTYVIYILIPLICCLIVKFAQQKNKKVYMFTVATILSLLAGLRGYSVGIDTPHYIQYFEMINNGEMSYIYGVETSFKWICFYLLRICSSPTFLFMIFSLITNFFVIMRIWDFKHIGSLSMMVFTYYVGFYFFQFNIMRQMIAVSIIFYFSRYIQKRRYCLYLVGVFFAICFHRSALIGVALLGTEIFEWKFLSKSQKTFLKCAISLIPIILWLLYGYLNKYAHYFEITDINWGLMLIIKLALFVFSFFSLQPIKIKKIGLYSSRQQQYNFSCVQYYYFFGILLTSLGYIFSFMDRIGLIFYIFETVYIGVVIKNGRYKNIFFLLYFLILLYVAIGSLISGGQGEIPYLFFWQ